VRNATVTTAHATRPKSQVLVVDDNATIREIVLAILDDAGLTCQQAKDGLEALGELRASPNPLVVLLDLMMPRIDGRAVLEAAEAEPQLVGRHAFVLVTAGGKTLPLALVQLLDRLHVPVVEKPFDIDRLVEVVAQAAARLDGE
jgi:CheY-like chemotaxis protein